MGTLNDNGSLTRDWNSRKIMANDS